MINLWNQKGGLLKTYFDICKKSKIKNKNKKKSLMKFIYSN